MSLQMLSDLDVLRVSSCSFLQLTVVFISRMLGPYIKLDGLPSTATPGDVNRMIRQYNVQNVVDSACRTS